MQNQHKPVLIFAQSGRFLAQSATLSGFTVWVADCFGDSDTLKVSERHQLLPPLANLSQHDLLQYLSDLTQGQDCYLVYGTGIEQYLSLLDKLPSHIELIANASDTINTIKQPETFFSLLSQLKICYPQTQFAMPDKKLGWLIKSSIGFGGGHICKLSESTKLNNDYYFQRYLQGESGSVLFLANGNGAKILSFNQQKMSSQQGQSFLFEQLNSPWYINTKHQNTLIEMVSTISASTKLIGLNSLDFIIANDELYILEINPRPSASMELLRQQAVFQWHFDACQGQLADYSGYHIGVRSLRYFFAEHNYIVPELMEWPNDCHDLPYPGQLIKVNEPICTSLVEAADISKIDSLHAYNHQKIIKQLTLEN